MKEMLLCYPWPGNIRELENLIERMMLLAKTPLITTDEIPLEFKAALEKDAFYGAKDEKIPFKDFMRA